MRAYRGRSQGASGRDGTPRNAADAIQLDIFAAQNKTAPAVRRPPGPDQFGKRRVSPPSPRLRWSAV